MPRSNLARAGMALVVVAILLMVLAPVALAKSTTCELSVTPAAGPPGTAFVLSGSGYTPTSLTLTKDGSAPRVLNLDLGSADPFTIRFVAAEGDVGHWKAQVKVGETGCVAATTLRVTLPSTSTISSVDPNAPNDRTPVLVAMAGLAVLFLAATAVLFRRPTLAGHRGRTRS